MNKATSALRSLRRRMPQRSGAAGALARFAARSAGWAAALFALNLLAPYTGVELAVNAASVAACGALGVPGLGVILCAAAMF